MALRGFGFLSLHARKSLVLSSRDSFKDRMQKSCTGQQHNEAAHDLTTVPHGRKSQFEDLQAPKSGDFDRE
jgi:hypothetical protein